MNYGQKPKWELASLLGAVMAYLALNNMDRVMIYDMKNMQRPYNVSGGKNAFPKVLRWLESLEYSGSVDMFAALKQMQRKGPGITVLISDFLQEELLEEENEQYEKNDAVSSVLQTASGNFADTLRRRTSCQYGRNIESD